jgi:hypothetical protein
VKPFVHIWQLWDERSPAGDKGLTTNTSRAYSLASDEYKNYIEWRTKTTGPRLIGKGYEWQASSATGSPKDTIVFEDRGTLGVGDARVGSSTTLPPTKSRNDQTGVSSYRTYYEAVPSGGGYGGATGSTASLNIQFESGSGFSDAMIGQGGNVQARGTCAEIYLFPVSNSWTGSGSSPIAAKPRYKLYFHPTGLLQVSTAAD